MPLQATSGAASYDAFGGGVPVVPAYIEEVFSCFLYTGNGSTQTITNGIDLSTNGGMVWTKCRSNGQNNWIFDTVRGPNSPLGTNITDSVADGYSTYFSPATNIVLGTTTGYSLAQTTGGTNTNNFTYVGWTFRKQPKFFDIVTYTGTGSARTIAHNLGSVPGCIIVRNLAGYNWQVYHRSLTSAAYSIQLNQTATQSSQPTIWDSTAPTSTNFTVGTSPAVNGAGNTYVAYVFAHNATGFGLTGTDNVISCGSFTCDGSGNATVNLGYEPQWIIAKEITTAGYGWQITDNMRGLPVTPSQAPGLLANTSDAEVVNVFYDLVPTSTGFNCVAFSASKQVIYIAIRRGPMKVPTTGTSVFKPVAQTGGPSNPIVTGFRVDASIAALTGAVSPRYAGDRLRGSTPILSPNDTTAEYNDGTKYFNFNVSNTGIVDNLVGGNAGVWWNLQRAPSFFDEVCFTSDSGGGTGANLPHNLTVQPNLMIFKARGSTSDWIVTCTEFASWQYFKMYLNSTTAKTLDGSGVANSSASTFSVFNNGQLPANSTCVAYLFATCAGVSKVGSYTGTGALQTVNCGFTSGARFVLIKRTDSTGDWWTYDSARGITSGNDPYLFLNSTAAEVTSTNYVDTDSTGFKVTAAAPAGLNASGGTYIFLAIA